jgi:protein-L-isoaspartate(D-aspartate) O-methyltransferase
MSRLERVQGQIVNKVRRMNAPLPPVSDRVIDAYFKMPRHLFVDRFREGGSNVWVTVTEKNFEELVPVLYRDAPLVIWGEDHVQSTISQPSFVLYMLDLLEIHPGQNVFELGTGSGWNAALISLLCDPGKVVTYEIISELAARANEKMRQLGLANIEVRTGDGMNLNSDTAFDRAVFTAGASDLPLSLHKAVRSGGRLLFVLERHVNSDLLVVFNKTEEGFESERFIECGFVPVTGTPTEKLYQPKSLQNVLQELELPERSSHHEEATSLILEHSSALQDFLSMHDEFIPLKRGEGSFAWRSVSHRSLAVVRSYQVEVFGEEDALTELQGAVEKWREWDRPSLEQFSLCVIPSKRDFKVLQGQVVMRRTDSVFLWRLNTMMQ